MTLFFQIVTSTIDFSYLKYKIIVTIIDHVSPILIVILKSAIVYLTCQKYLF